MGSIFLTVTWMHGADGALWLIIWRVVQGIGGAFLFANSAAIASALTGRRPKVAPPGEPLGYELAAAAGEGGFAPSELVIPADSKVVPVGGEESTETTDTPD